MKERIERHKDGTIKAKGHIKAGELTGGILGVVQKRRHQNAFGIL